MIEAKVANSISAMLLALASCLTAAQADVPAGTGNWSTEQTWGTDPNHGNQPLKGFYYWPRSGSVANIWYERGAPRSGND
jgi:hypothetical protein